MKIELENEYFFYIGTDKKRLDNLSLFVSTKFSELPISRKILGNDENVYISTLSQMFCKKLGKPVYVSYNIEEETINFENLVPILRNYFLEDINMEQMHSEINNLKIQE